MRRRGQTSMESLVGIVFMMLLLLIVSLLALQKSNEGNDLKKKSDADRTLAIFTDNVNTIAKQGSGFYKYFSLPDSLYGDTGYNITVTGNLAEIDSADYAEIKELLTSNVTVVCLDKDLMKRNKVYSDQEKLYVICNKPELIAVNGSFRPFSAAANQTMNVSVTIMNFGPVDAGQFKVTVNNTINVTVASLASEEKITVCANVTAPAKTGPCYIPVTIDSGSSVNESIESNNFYNATVNVV